MTVAAAVLAATPELALGDADGTPRVRRIADAAWSGGALPIVVVSFDPEGAVAAALAGAEVTLGEPVAPESGPVAQICRAIDIARDLVAEVDAALVWPARLCWVGPETVTSLVEAHGTRAGSVLVPTWHGEAGWPKLLPIAHLEAFRGLAPNRMPDDLFADLLATGVPAIEIELGDPGVAIDGGTPIADLPPYEGPREPAADHVHEWGEAVAGLSETAPTPPRTVRRSSD